jgi:hypothetical protein
MKTTTSAAPVAARLLAMPPSQWAHSQAVNGQGIEQDVNVFRLTQISQNSANIGLYDQPLVGSVLPRRRDV